MLQPKDVADILTSRIRRLEKALAENEAMWRQERDERRRLERLKLPLRTLFWRWLFKTGGHF